MLLAIDTATKWTSLALHDGRAIVAENGWQAQKNQTVELAPAVANLLRRANLAPTDLAAVAVAIGPGSYTGLRIGLGFAKGLALANGTRLIGVPTLDILAASQPKSEGQLVAVAEAGRTRVCVAEYQWKGSKGWQSDQQPLIDSWENILSDLEGPITFAGEITPAAAKMIRAASKTFSVAGPADSLRRAGYLAEIGWRRLRRGWTDDPATLAPVYLLDPAGARQ